MCLQRTYCRGNGEKISANTDPGHSETSRKTQSAQRNRPGDSDRSHLARTAQARCTSRSIVMQVKKASKTSTCLVPLPFMWGHSGRQNRL
ncbi:hypothetical protein D3C78_1377690 [compost metagenome]